MDTPALSVLVLQLPSGYPYPYSAALFAKISMESIARFPTKRVVLIGHSMAE